MSVDAFNRSWCLWTTAGCALVVGLGGRQATAQARYIPVPLVMIGVESDAAEPLSRELRAFKRLQELITQQSADIVLRYVGLDGSNLIVEAPPRAVPLLENLNLMPGQVSPIQGPDDRRFPEFIITFDQQPLTARELDGRFTSVRTDRRNRYQIVRARQKSVDEASLDLLTQRGNQVDDNFPVYGLAGLAALQPWPNDPYFVQARLGNLEDIHAKLAWDAVYRPDGPLSHDEVVVAVVDTGIGYGHPELKERMWSNKAPTPLEHTHGLNIIGLLDGNTDPADGHGHGSHVAGIIAAREHNARGIVGIAWNARLMAIKIFDDQGNLADSAPDSDAAYVAIAIDHAMHRGARIINASWYLDAMSDKLETVIERGRQEGILFVAAAGNGERDVGFDIDDKPRYPASYRADNIITVMASMDGAIPQFSNYGARSVDIAAPGVDITSTVGNAGKEQYIAQSGTSMAAAHVSAAAAMIMGIPECRGITPSEIRHLLMGTSQYSPHLEGRCVSGGVLDLDFLYRATSVERIHGRQRLRRGDDGDLELGTQYKVDEESMDPEIRKRVKNSLDQEVTFTGVRIGGRTKVILTGVD